MARPEVQGLKYFPFDVGFFRDKKVRLLRGEHNAEGVEIYQRLICKCYEGNGYFLQWDGEADYALLAEETGYSIDKIRLVVSSCLKWSLFDNTLFMVGNVLTSRGIQRRYFSAIKDAKMKAAAQHGRHTTISADICLLDETDFSEFNKTYSWLEVAQKSLNSGNNPGKSPINPSKSPINPAKEIKEKKRKLKDSTIYTSVADIGSEAAAEKIVRHYLNHIQPDAHGAVVDKLCGWLDSFPADVIMAAIDRAVLQNKRSYSYIEGILRGWEREGLTTLSLVEGRLRAWDEKKAHRGETKDNPPRQFKTAYERTLESAKMSIDKYNNGEMRRIDI